MDRAELERELQALHADSFAWALACCDRDRDDAEDVLQTVYVKIFDGKARFEARASFKTWLFAVIRRTASSHRRTRWFRALRFVERNGDEHESVEQNLVRSERAAALVRSLAQLARRQREVLELVFYHDMTIEQAGQTLGISLGTARIHYERGKKRLVTLIGDEAR